CLAQLQTAVNLVRGELLAGLNFPSDTWEAWLIAQREHVQQRVLEAMTHLREAQIARGEWTAVLDIAQRQLRQEPWLEAAHRAIMQAHYHLGSRNMALAQYEQCELLLWDELGVEPEAETQYLRQQIFDDGLMRVETAVPDNLPLQPTRFFGRESEQKQLLQRLVDPGYRLITLIGTGGIGKTRLALEAGRQVKASFADGVWFVSLDAIKGGAEQIKIAIGEAAGLGLAEKQSTGEQVLALLREKQLLLILDNCETALNDLAFIPEWLKRAPRLAILATSREPLNFQAESVLALDGLPIGREEMSAAEAMFAEHGQMARDEFVITAENLPQVRHICQLVDGSPLGIALAAAWVRRRSLTQIVAGINHSLDFLSSRLRDADPRHRSMQAVFETSWQLLEANEQAVLAALSVFPTTFTAVAAQSVAGASQFDLDLLCEKSLLQQHHESERYALHSLLRQFAADKLAARTPHIEHGFVDYFYQFAHEQQSNYARLQPEWPNLLTAVSKAHALAKWQVVLDFVRTLDKPWFRQIRFNDMRQGLLLAVEAATTLQDQPALAQMLLRLGEIETELNDYTLAESHLAQAMQLLTRLEDGLGIAQAKYLYGRIYSEQSQDDKALQHFTEAKRIFAEEEDSLGVARNLNLIALCHMKQNPDFQAAQAHLQQSVAIQSHLPPSATYIEALRYLARVKGVLGEYGAAEGFLIEAAKVSHILQDKGEYAAVLFDRIVLCRRQNQLETALQFATECLDLFQKLGSLRWEALVKTQLAILHQAKNNHQHALQLFRDGLQIYVELGDLYEQAYSHYYLFKLYGEIGATEQGQRAKQQALQLNAILDDPQLRTRLE
ncbi:MAG: tetratricopeptide repeat protein, partial [Anaerolineales bacterium]|nr:tetratricopeptide repeat protein [Anaerolineales bacterium]